jgi:hypothetical protein
MQSAGSKRRSPSRSRGNAYGLSTVSNKPGVGALRAAAIRCAARDLAGQADTQSLISSVERFRANHDRLLTPGSMEPSLVDIERGIQALEKSLRLQQSVSAISTASPLPAVRTPAARSVPRSYSGPVIRTSAVRRPNPTNCAEEAANLLRETALPLGWSPPSPDDGIWGWPLKVLGLLISVGAATLGAPILASVPRSDRIAS